jgi:hypothetical protein
MRTHFKSVAACALAVVIIVTSTSFLMFMMMAHPNFSATSAPGRLPALAHSFSAAGTVLLVAYIAGAWAWIMMFALRRSGVHRLERVLSRVEKS